MGLFDNPNFKAMHRVAGKPIISVTKSGVGFSKQILSRLGYTHYVQIFINTKDKQLGVKACDQNAPDAMKFISAKKDKANSLRWNNPTFKEEIQSLAPEELKNTNYSCEGKYYPEENAFLFDFSKAYASNNEDI